ncbi:MAG: hypothetical protein K0S76_1008 [Herbinix sp.]|jgi:hypothetical protein|nr:hypothetical protein [Herbinix sp.]
MQGLRTQENQKFNKFWNLIQSTAKNQGKVFFCDCGEGREFFLEDMEGEDLRGWLIPLDKANEFEPNWLVDNVSDVWLDNLCWAEWKDTNGMISVEFITY